MRFLKLILVLLFIAVPLVASADKAKTIDELAKMYDSSSCKGCHEDIYTQWEKSHHARPLMGVKDGLMLIPVVKSSAFAPKDPKQATMKNFPCFKNFLHFLFDCRQVAVRNSNLVRVCPRFSPRYAPYRALLWYRGLSAYINIIIESTFDCRADSQFGSGIQF